MTILKKLVTKLAMSGEVEHDVLLPDGSSITLRPLTPAQSSAAYGMVTLDVLRKANGDKKEELLYQNDTLARARTVALLAFSIKKIDGEEVLERDITRAEELEERQTMFLELLDMEEPVLDLLATEQANFSNARRDFFADRVKNVEK